MKTLLVILVESVIDENTENVQNSGMMELLTTCT